MNYWKLIKKHGHLLIDVKCRNIPRLRKFYSSYKKYKALSESEKLSVSDWYPCINDSTTITPFDAHYFYQGIWAFEKIKKSGVKSHVDVGSEIRWVGLLSTITKVTFIDIRPFETELKELTVKKGSILSLPFEDESVDSLSSLHVAEHIGLGRYGDRLDPDGTKKACKGLSRILAPNGNLYFSVPVGKQKTYFNAHRVHSAQTFIDYFKDLNLIELSGVTDSGRFIENIDINVLEKSTYACGLFWFHKDRK
jgi:SAM-dependent methyltransferase